MSRAVMTSFAAAFALLLTASTALAADPVLVDLSTNQPRTVTVGDRVRYTVVVEVDEGTSIALAPAALPPEVALVDTPDTMRQTIGEGREQVTISFELAPFVPGQVELPPLPLRYVLADGSDGSIEAPASTILVASVLPPDGQLAPRDLKPQAEIGTPPATWPLTALGALVAGLLFLILAAFVRSRLLRYRAARAMRRQPVLVGPEDIARGILRRTGAQFAEDGDYIRYYTNLGNTVRYYLTQRYGFPAFALTTRELEEAMLALGLDRWQVRVAGGLLAQCDAVVYAQYRPAPERADADLTSAYEIVEMSRPEERPMQEREEQEASVS